MLCHQLFSVGFFFQAEDGIRVDLVTGVQTCALPILIGKSNQLCKIVHFVTDFFVLFHKNLTYGKQLFF